MDPVDPKLLLKSVVFPCAEKMGLIDKGKLIKPDILTQIIADPRKRYHHLGAAWDLMDAYIWEVSEAYQIKIIDRMPQDFKDPRKLKSDGKKDRRH